MRLAAPVLSLRIFFILGRDGEKNKKKKPGEGEQKKEINLTRITVGTSDKQQEDLFKNLTCFRH